jgi:hypothetical protein
MSIRRSEPDDGGDSAMGKSGDHDGDQPQGGAQEPPSGDAPEAGLEATVVAYLCAHHDFFEHNPEVLTHLQVSHGPSGAVSLIEHQVKVLRRQLDTERARLTHLITRAREYESLSTRLHGLVLQLIPATDLVALRDALQDALRREFSAEAVTLRLFPLDPKAAGDSDPLNDPLTDAFRGFLDREHALCGPLDADKSRVLFGDRGGSLRSAALIPIRAEGRSGVLAIGAADPERFKLDMGTDLLDRLGEIVGHKLRTLSPDPVPTSTRKPAARSTGKSAQNPPRPADAAKPSPAGPEQAPESNAEAQSD